MTKTAMKALAEATRDNDKGFFLMIEGSRIDDAGHANDPAAQVHEVLAYDKAFSSVLEFLEKNSVPGVMISTSDHETGGLSAAKQLHTTYPDYLWYPGALGNASHSSEHLARQYFTHLRSLPQHGAHSSTSDDVRAYLTDLLATGLGVHDATSEEMQILLNHPEISFYTFADIISRRSQTGWSTHGHSAVDVNIYASDARAAKALAGNHENTEVGEFLARWLDVDVGAVTKELREKGVAFDTVGEGGERESWMGRIAEEGERLHGLDHLDHAEWDFGKMMHKRCNVCGA
ncbi:vacuolar alkaline phosphatase [Cryomyces antarcticus]|uniref:alkaline phosphatase n=1 Tax=Cryomyces antarcticus TaxID=329879 RepID=A0ABR0LQV7_9PEZI|nr:vacuolar alkaline phosphatase [Cryomyces antarcticus]